MNNGNTSDSDDMPDDADRLGETNPPIDAAAADVVSLLDEYLDQLNSGAKPDQEAFLAKHAQHADALRACLASLDFLATQQGSLRGEKQLGDFRLLREIGQGGMGTVYEALQVSLGRKVALKVVRAGLQSQAALERFRREAETVAALHHTNIVPIFAVGVEGEINYFAMQLIEGNSLADLSRQSEGPFPPTQVAEWGLAVSDALTHAHERGVVHRDVKPSNILQDRDGGIWLSDFGLAKRTDDLTLSLSGAVLGTPRYMSPEQASGEMKEADHRSDIYSLGATLYELSTGKPVFAADSPQEIIAKILRAEPEHPSALMRPFPRDLETVLLKCLHKDPADRYQTATELADDLRAFCSGRPIRSRQMGIAERGVKWLRKERSTMASVAISVIATVVIGIVGFAVEQWRELALTQDFHIDANVPGAVAEVLDETGRSVCRPISLPTPEPISLSVGEYQVRGTAPGRLSVTTRLRVEPAPVIGRDEQPNLHLDFDEGYQGRPINIRGTYAMLPARGKLIELHAHGLTCHDVAQANVTWHSLVESWATLTSDSLAFSQRWKGAMLQAKLQPRVITQVGDMNNDGVGDLLLASQDQTWVVAISGIDGRPIWLSESSSKKQRNVGCPLVVPDIDEDRFVDLISIHGYGDRPSEYSVSAISGKTGQQIWCHDIAGNEPGNEASSTATIWAPQLLQVDGHRLILSGHGRAGRAHALTTGEEVHAIDLPGAPARAPLIGDIDGDGASELLALAFDVKTKKTTLAIWSVSANKLLSVKPLNLFVPPSPSPSPRTFLTAVPAQETWPQFVDLNGDELPELIMPAQDHLYSEDVKRLCAIDPVDGEKIWSTQIKAEHSQLDQFVAGPDINGDGFRDIWVASLWHDNYNQPSKLFVDAVSGADGRTLWTTSSPLHHETLDPARFEIAGVSWWESDPSNWPSLLVSVHPKSSRQHAPVSFCFSAGSGEVRHVAPHVAQLASIDVDGDRIDDLVAFGIDRMDRNEGLADAKISVLSGNGSTNWRRIASGPSPWPVDDLNGDGVGDLIHTAGAQASASVKALSGLNGTVLWENVHPSGSWQTHEVYSPPPGDRFDIDADGIRDVLWFGYPPHATLNQPLAQAISGATGKRLWEADVNIEEVWKHSLVELRDLDGDGQAEVILVGAVELGGRRRFHKFATSYASPYANPAQLTLLVLDQKTGKLKWHKQIGDSGQPYLEESSFDRQLRRHDEPYEFDIDFVDANQDKVLDIVTPVDNFKTQMFELQILDGTNGKTLSRKPLGKFDSLLQLPRVTVTDLNGDGEYEVVLASCKSVSVQALNGLELGRTKLKGGSRELGLVNQAKLRHANGCYFAVSSDGIEKATIILGAQGKSICPPIPINNAERTSFVAADIDADNVDELIMASDGALRAISVANNNAVRWETDVRTSSDERQHPPISITNVRREKGEVVIRIHGPDGRIMGLELSTGRITWTQKVHTRRHALLLRNVDRMPSIVEATPPSSLLHSPQLKSLPGELICRQPIAYDLLASPATPAPSLPEARRDVRHRILLPWAVDFNAIDWLRVMPLIATLGLFNTVTLIIIPISMLRYTAIKRRWSMRELLMFPVVAAVCLLGVVINREIDLRSKLLYGLWFLPFIVYFAYFGKLCWSRSWLAIVGWLLATIAGSAALVAYVMSSYGYLVQQDAERAYYAYDHWYVGLLFGVWGMGALLGLIYAAVLTGRLAHRCLYSRATVTSDGEDVELAAHEVVG